MSVKNISDQDTNVYGRIIYKNKCLNDSTKTLDYEYYIRISNGDRIQTNGDNLSLVTENKYFVDDLLSIVLNLFIC